MYPSIDMKRADQAKVYDPKKSVWIPDEKTRVIQIGGGGTPPSRCCPPPSRAVPPSRKFCGIYDYLYVSQGKTNVASFDDNEESEYTEDALNVLGFNDEEKFGC